MTFRAKAAAWRKLAVMPALPDDTERQRLLAENAFQGKDVDLLSTTMKQALTLSQASFRYCRG
jgi:hypothetical protein